MVADSPFSWFVLLCVAFYFGVKFLIRSIDEYENKYK